MCDECFYKFKTPLNILERSKDRYSLALNYEKVVFAIKKCGFPEEVSSGILTYTEILKQTVTDKLQQDIDNQIEDVLKLDAKAKRNLQLKEKVTSYRGVISGQ